MEKHNEITQAPQPEKYRYTIAPVDFIKELIGEVEPEIVDFLLRKYEFPFTDLYDFDPDEPFDYPPGSVAFGDNTWEDLLKD